MKMHLFFATLAITSLCAASAMAAKDHAKEPGHDKARLRRARGHHGTHRDKKAHSEKTHPAPSAKAGAEGNAAPSESK